MRLTSYLICLSLALAMPIGALAQPEAEPPDEADAAEGAEAQPPAPEEASDADLESESATEDPSGEALEAPEAGAEEQTELTPPALAPLTAPPPVLDAAEEDETAGEAEPEPELPDPADAVAMLEVKSRNSFSLTSMIHDPWPRTTWRSVALDHTPDRWEPALIGVSLGVPTRSCRCYAATSTVVSGTSASARVTSA